MYTTINYGELGLQLSLKENQKRTVSYKEKIRTHVEGTTYNHGRPEGISEDQHPMNQFLGMLYGQVRP